MSRRKQEQSNIVWNCKAQGHKAYRKGVPMEANPYKKGTVEAKAWLMGWEKERARSDSMLDHILGPQKGED